MTRILILLLLMTAFSSSQAEPVQPYVKQLYTQWAEIRYNVVKDQREAQFERLKQQSEQLSASHPNDADLWVWRGIISSTYAGEVGGLSALSSVKEAKHALEKALKLDPLAFGGSAYTSLGALYYQVPGWPISFGDDDEAEKLLKKGLEISPNSIDANFFYADFLIDQGRESEAKTYINKAEQAAARPDRPVADKGRREELVLLKSKV